LLDILSRQNYVAVEVGGFLPLFEVLLMERLICARCPQCGSGESIAVAPAKNVAFRKDRQCQRCDTCYSPPTPIWGAALFIVLGAIIVVGCSLSIVLSIAHGSPAGLPLNFGFGVLGVLCVRQGVLSLREIVVQAPPSSEPAPPAVQRSIANWALRNWFGIGFGMAFVAGLTIFISFCVRSVQQAEMERTTQESKYKAAIQALKQAGGQVYGWGRQQEATSISLRRADEQTRMFEGQQVGNREIVDDDLRVIALFPNLERLQVASPEISDAGLRQIPEQSSLTSLSVECPLVTDEGLTFVGKMSRLEYLDLSGTAVSNLATLRLDQKPYLTDLKLCGTSVTDSTSQSLATAKSLTALDLSQTAISDGTLLRLIELPLLEDLRLDNTMVTDEGIQILRHLPQLKFLSVDETHVTAEGCAELKKLLPKCRIVRRWLPGPGGIMIAPQG
jgi:hypothetical protein